jgi:HEAT repeat protein
MNSETSHKPPYAQPRLFGPESTTTGIAELFPAIWNAAEDLSNPIPSVRQLALECLENTGAARISPLVSYLIATRLNDPDLELRSRVVKVLGEIFAPDSMGNVAPETVTTQLVHYLSDMRTRQIFSLIQVLHHNPELAPHVIRILNVCLFAGNHLIEMANSRKIPLEVRRTAIWLISQVGYLEAIPALERLQIRMETRITGQQSMPFAPPLGVDDSDLLPDVKDALLILRSP